MESILLDLILESDLLDKKMDEINVKNLILNNLFSFW